MWRPIVLSILLRLLTVTQWVLARIPQVETDFDSRFTMAGAIGGLTEAKGHIEMEIESIKEERASRVALKSIG